MRSQTRSPLQDNCLCSYLNKLWMEGWLDSFAEEHFLISSIYNQLSGFHGREQLEENNLNLFSYQDNIGINFAINFSNKLEHMSKVFGEKEIKHFVENQLSAGKENYDEDQFLRGLTELEILQYYSSFVCSLNKQVHYEPKIRTNLKNPEARFIYDDNVIVDIEVKTPGFSNESIQKKLLLPTVLLDQLGLDKLQNLCKVNNVKCLLPRIYKLVDFLNSAAEKFEAPTSSKHLNLLYINWSYSEFPSKSFLEAYAILFNEFTGLLNHKEIGVRFGAKEEVYENISAVIVYTSSLNNLITQDFRYLWSTRNFSIIPIKADEQLILRATSMDYMQNVVPPLILADFKSVNIDDSVEEAYICTEAAKIIKNSYIR